MVTTNQEVIFSIRDRNGTTFTVESRPNQFDEQIVNYRLVIESRQGESYCHLNREEYQAFIQAEYGRLFKQAEAGNGEA